MQLPGDETAKNMEVCVLYLLFKGYIRQGALLGDTVISTACTDKNQQSKVSISI
jgi:hypothetical protein